MDPVTVITLALAGFLPGQQPRMCKNHYPGSALPIQEKQEYRDADSSGANLRLEECELLTKYYLRDGSVGNPPMVLKLIQEIKI